MLRILFKYFKYVLNIRLNVMLCGAIVVLMVLLATCMHKARDEENIPVIVWWTKGFPGTFETRTCANGFKCNIVNSSFAASTARAYLFYGSAIDFSDLPLPRRSDNIIWALFHEESPRNVPELLHDTVLGLFNYSSTFSRHSDLPFTLQYLNSAEEITSKQYFVSTQDKNNFLKELAPVLYLQSDCETSTERDAFVTELMRHVRVDSYGECINNKQLPERFKQDYLNKLNDEEFLKFTARYKFVVAIENGVCDDYITEKLWRAIRVGSVPIYFGSPSVRDWLPNHKSAILLQDFNTVDKLVKHLKELLNDDRMYDSYLQHKWEGVITNERLLQELKIRPGSADVLETVTELECLVCAGVHHRQAGSGSARVTRRHYDCPRPVSALTLDVNPYNDWLYSWEVGRRKAQEIFNKITEHK